MMKKFLSVFAIIVVAGTALASPTGTRKGDQVLVPLSEGDKNNDKSTGRPQAPALSLFTVFWDTDLGSLFVSSRYDVGEVSATIENLLTGDFYSYTFDSADSALLPINGSAGFWTITLTLDNGTEFAGEFQL